MNCDIINTIYEKIKDGEDLDKQEDAILYDYIQKKWINNKHMWSHIPDNVRINRHDITWLIYKVKKPDLVSAKGTQSLQSSQENDNVSSESEGGYDSALTEQSEIESQEIEEEKKTQQKKRGRKPKQNKMDMSEKVICEICRGEYSRWNKTHHMRTKYHKMYAGMANNLRNMMFQNIDPNGNKVAKKNTIKSPYKDILSDKPNTKNVSSNENDFWAMIDRNRKLKQ